MPERVRQDPRHGPLARGGPCHCRRRTPAAGVGVVVLSSSWRLGFLALSAADEPPLTLAGDTAEFLDIHVHGHRGLTRLGTTSGRTAPHHTRSLPTSRSIRPCHHTTRVPDTPRAYYEKSCLTGASTVR